ncbi:hypothetical protein CBL_21169, partial [Carabus blaptoides fortunei]
MNAAGVGIVLVYALEEMERKKQNRDLHRRLRDASDPFSLPEENFRKLYRFTRELCDSDLKIIGINARFPESVHDAAIWMRSSLNQFLENNFRDGDRTTRLL